MCPPGIDFFVRLTVSAIETSKCYPNFDNQWSLVTQLQLTACAAFSSLYALRLTAKGLKVCPFGKVLV